YRVRYDQDTGTVRRERTTSGTNPAGNPVTVTNRVDSEEDASATSTVDQRVDQGSRGEYDETTQVVSTDAKGKVTGSQTAQGKARRAANLDIGGTASQSGLRTVPNISQANADGTVVASRQKIDEQADSGYRRVRDSSQKATSFDATGNP